MVVIRRIEGTRGVTMRLPVMIALTAGLASGLAACAPTVPDSGVGFNDYDSYLRQQQAAATAVTPVAPFGTATAPQGGFSPDLAAAAIDRATGVAPATAPLDPFAANTPLATTQPLSATQPGVTAAFDPNDPNRPRGNAPLTIQEQSGEMVHNNTATISDEQDFAAVSERETIESDKQRLERNRQQYTVIQPTAVPERTETGPNIVQYALSTTHPPGTQMYSRSALRLTDPNVACARYASPDLAQQAFLAAGGPDRDRKGLDPDGDGYACAWDPRPFRQ
jgi:hypothetical protein